jgi:hypothetical protein
LEGRTDVVKALHDIHLYPGSEFYPIRRLDSIIIIIIYHNRRSYFILLI